MCKREKAGNHPCFDDDMSDRGHEVFIHGSPLHGPENEIAALRRGSALMRLDFNGWGRICPKRPIQSGFGLADAEVAKVSQRVQKGIFKIFPYVLRTLRNFCVPSASGSPL